MKCVPLLVFCLFACTPAISPQEQAFTTAACDLEQGVEALAQIVRYNQDYPDNPIGSKGIEHWQMLLARYRDALAAVDSDTAAKAFWTTHADVHEGYFENGSDAYAAVVDQLPGSIERLRSKRPEAFVALLAIAAAKVTQPDYLKVLADAAMAHASSPKDWVDTAGIFAIAGDFYGAQEALSRLSKDDLPTDSQFGAPHLVIAWIGTLGMEAAVDHLFRYMSPEWVVVAVENAATRLIDEGEERIAGQLVTHPRLLALIRKPTEHFVNHDRYIALFDQLSDSESTVALVRDVMKNINNLQPTSALSGTDYLVRGLARYRCSQACLDAVLEHMPTKDAANENTRVTVASTRNVVLTVTGRLADASTSDPESLIYAAALFAGARNFPDYIEPLVAILPPEHRDTLYAATTSSTYESSSRERRESILTLIRRAPMHVRSEWATPAIVTADDREIRRAILTRATGGCPATAPRSDPEKFEERR